MVTRILVATDFSSNAEAAWDFALDFARRANAETLLLHVTMPPTTGMSGTAREDHERHVGRAHRVLHQWAAKAISHAIPVKTVVSAGDPAPMIATAARDHGADVVVVGSHGLGQPDRILIGSVAERLIRLAPCTVIVAKPVTTSVQRDAA
jgi:nucleotide-binding universal stress UspA family protein